MCGRPNFTRPFPISQTKRWQQGSKYHNLPENMDSKVRPEPQPKKDYYRIQVCHWSNKMTRHIRGHSYIYRMHPALSDEMEFGDSSPTKLGGFRGAAPGPMIRTETRKPGYRRTYGGCYSIWPSGVRTLRCGYDGYYMPSHHDFLGGLRCVLNVH